MTSNEPRVWLLPAVAALAVLPLAGTATAAPTAVSRPAPAAAAVPAPVLIPVVKPTVKVTPGDLAVNVTKAAAHCTGYEHAGTAKEFIDFPGSKFGQLMVFKNFGNGKLCITQHATKRVTSYYHLSSIELFEVDCSTPIRRVRAKVRTKLVELKFQPRLAQDVCIEGGNSVVLDRTRPKITTFASGTIVVRFI